MKSLIAKLEQASEGSRELDAAIWETQGYVRKKSKTWHIPTTPEKIYVDTWRTPSGKEIAPFYEDEGVTPDDIPPHFTTSLDAALTLVPEGWAWRIQNNGLTALCAPDNDLGDYSKGATPALSCCIASLKARA